MATTIKIKNSVTATTTPTSLVQGEVAINVTDKKVWVGNAATTPIQIVGAGTTGNAAGSNNQVQYNSSGSFAGDADFTFNGTTVTMANDASISGLTVGKGGGAVSNNTVVGLNAGVANTTGKITTVGYLAARFNTTGSGNTAVGGNDAAQDGALYSNTTGNYNIAMGTGAVASNTTGSSNTGLGYSALQNNTTASNNTAVGYQAAYSNVTGASITAVGYKSLYAATGNNNTAIGKEAGLSTTTGTNNAFLGAFAAYANTTGANNVALGYEALQANTTANNNIAVGYQAGYSNTTSNNNIFIGLQAGYNANTTGTTYNTFVGNQAGYFVTTGTKNTILGGYGGNQGGLDIRTASNYIVLSDGDGNPRGVFDNSGNFIVNGASQLGLLTGYFNGAAVSGLGLQTSRTTTGSNFAVFNNSAGNIAGYIQHNGTTTVNYATSSDYRLKENVAPITDALTKVSQLKPVTYTWKNTDNEQGEGFIAHELAEVCPLAVCGEKDGVDVDGKPVYQGIDPAKLVGLLTAAIQELKAEVDSLKAQLNNGA